MENRKKVRLGKTEIIADKVGFGALPIQRTDEDTAVGILQKAYQCGVNFFDTARSYTDSERKIGLALSSVRDKIFIATKTMARTGEEVRKELEMSLKELNTDYIDLYQSHNLPFCPKPGGEDGVYDAFLEAKSEGKIRHIGITNHRMSVAEEAIESGLYETLQFPFSYISTEKEIALAARCREADIGFIAMKALAGGLLHRPEAAVAWQNEFDNVLPIWGIQKEEELDLILECQENICDVNGSKIAGIIEEDRRELSGDFCRGCGYCMPCPVGIEINNCARMSLLLRRAPTEKWLSPEYQQKMSEIKNCIGCGQCAKKCPYGLNPQKLLKKNLKDYTKFIKQK